MTVKLINVIGASHDSSVFFCNHIANVSDLSCDSPQLYRYFYASNRPHSLQIVVEN